MVEKRHESVCGPRSLDGLVLDYMASYEAPSRAHLSLARFALPVRL